MQRNNGPSAPKRLRFGTFLLDFERGSLFADDSEVSLRPKTFAVLCFLVANRGRLVSKDELFDAVWSGIAVTDDALVQSVGELRRALGADGARLIKTIPRRGYRFEAEIETVPEIPNQTPSGPTVSSSPAPALAVETNRKTRWRTRRISSFVVVCSPNKSKADLEAQPVIAILPFASEEHTLGETAGANFSRVLLAAAYAEDNRTKGAARTVNEIRRLEPTFDPQEFGTKFLNPEDLKK
jgi:DNA-binding winged helix-turn-helix (wHTH) protein